MNKKNKLHVLGMVVATLGVFTLSAIIASLFRKDKSMTGTLESLDGVIQNPFDFIRDTPSYIVDAVCHNSDLLYTTIGVCKFIKFDTKSQTLALSDAMVNNSMYFVKFKKVNGKYLIDDILENITEGCDY